MTSAASHNTSIIGLMSLIILDDDNALVNIDIALKSIRPGERYKVILPQHRVWTSYRNDTMRDAEFIRSIQSATDFHHLREGVFAAMRFHDHDANFDDRDKKPRRELELESSIPVPTTAVAVQKGNARWKVIKNYHFPTPPEIPVQNKAYEAFVDIYCLPN